MNITLDPWQIRWDGSRSTEPLGSGQLRGLVARNRHGVSRARRFVETVADRQRGSRRSIQLRSVNFWSGKLQFAESMNSWSQARSWHCTIGNYIVQRKEAIMCGRVRLSSDYSEIKIRLKFSPKLLRRTLSRIGINHPLLRCSLPFDPLMASAYRR